jgi:hypothetical protein
LTHTPEKNELEQQQAATAENKKSRVKEIKSARNLKSLRRNKRNLEKPTSLQKMIQTMMNTSASFVWRPGATARAESHGYVAPTATTGLMKHALQDWLFTYATIPTPNE